MKSQPCLHTQEECAFTQSSASAFAAELGAGICTASFMKSSLNIAIMTCLVCRVDKPFPAPAHRPTDAWPAMFPLCPIWYSTMASCCSTRSCGLFKLLKNTGLFLIFATSLMSVESLARVHKIPLGFDLGDLKAVMYLRWRT